MLTYEMILDGTHSPAEVRAAVEEACGAAGLTATSTGTLKTYPGSVHWHYRSGKERGVLEITHWPRENRLWLSTRPGRDADWVLDALHELGELLSARLGGMPIA